MYSQPQKISFMFENNLKRPKIEDDNLFRYDVIVEHLIHLINALH